MGSVTDTKLQASLNDKVRIVQPGACRVLGGIQLGTFGLTFATLRKQGLPPRVTANQSDSI